MHQARLLFLLTALALVAAENENLLQEIQRQPPSDANLLLSERATRCPVDATSCRRACGSWGCCPYPRATCCSDGVHCCPDDYSCDVAGQGCVKAAVNKDTIPLAVMADAQQLPEWSSDVIAPINSSSSQLTCADQVSRCPAGAACCRTYPGAYSCCKSPNNVCCSDGVSCCPRCSICDLVNKRCISDSTTQYWTPMTLSIPAAADQD